MFLKENCYAHQRFVFLFYKKYCNINEIYYKVIKLLK